MHGNAGVGGAFAIFSFFRSSLTLTFSKSVPWDCWFFCKQNKTVAEEERSIFIFPQSVIHNL
jgi:hypothetical protein